MIGRALQIVLVLALFAALGPSAAFGLALGILWALRALLRSRSAARAEKPRSEPRSLPPSTTVFEPKRREWVVTCRLKKPRRFRKAGGTAPFASGSKVYCGRSAPSPEEVAVVGADPATRAMTAGAVRAGWLVGPRPKPIRSLRRLIRLNRAGALLFSTRREAQRHADVLDAARLVDRWGCPPPVARLLPAAFRGEAEAALALAALYEHGADDVPADPTEAARWRNGR